MIEVRWKTNITEGLVDISFSELNVRTQEEWDLLNIFDQKERIENHLRRLYDILPVAQNWGKEIIAH